MTALLLAGAPMLLALHCDPRRSQPNPSANSASAAISSPVASVSIPAPGLASAAPSSSAPKALTAAESRAYQAALGKGRLATQKQDWAAACAAFDQALAIAPEDARARAERGYARLLADDLDGAAKDFAAAQGHSSDKKLEAQIWYNAGLVAERRSNSEEARAAFARSFALNPTAAANGKLDGKSRCIVGTDRSLTAPKNYPNWRAVWNGLAANAGVPAPATDVAARNALHIDTCPTVCVGNTDHDGRFHLFFPRTDGSVEVHEKIGEGHYYRCGTPPGVTIVDGSNPLHVVVANQLIEVGVSCHGRGAEEVCMMNCGGPLRWYRNDLFYDLATHQRLLSLSQTGSGEHDKVTETTREPKVDAEGVEFDGAGCGRTKVKFKSP
jgi:hypothetical protein